MTTHSKEGYIRVLISDRWKFIQENQNTDVGLFDIFLAKVKAVDKKILNVWFDSGHGEAGYKIQYENGTIKTYPVDENII